MKKFLLSFIATAMCISLISPYQPVEADTNPSTTPETLLVQETETPSFQKEIELIEERTATTQVFQQEDGTHRMEISPEPIHVQDAKTKKWVPIDNTLVEKSTGRHHNAKNNFDASFTNDIASGEPLVSLKQKGKTVEIKSIKHKGKKATAVDAVTEENQVTYEEIYPNTDLVYTVGNTKIKEDIVLKEKPAGTEPLSYAFDFQITGMTLERTADGYLYLVDAVTKDRLFAIEKPFMMDSSTPEGFVSNMPNPVPEGAWTDAIEVDAQQTGDQLTLTLKPDLAWLQNPERVYPVVLDPTVKVYQPNYSLNDTTIRSALPDTTGGADHELGAGLYKNSTTNNVVRSLLQFDMGSLPRGAKIMNAQLNLRLSSVWNDTAASVQLYETSSAWEENRATWNRRTLDALWANKGGDYSTTLLSSQTIGALDPTATAPPLFKWPIKAETVQKWMDTPSQNLGLMLKGSNETLATYKKFYSGDAGGMLNYSPKLTITYYPISRLGTESYWSYFDHELSDGQGSVNVGTGNLVVDVTDFSVSGRGNSGLDFSRTYNSKSVEHSPLGYGWSFSGSETVSEFPNRDVLYQDTDGTTHLFIFNATTGTYTTPKGLYRTLAKANADAFVLTDFNGNRTVFRDLIKNPEVDSRIYRIDYEEDRNKNRMTYQRNAEGALTGIMDASGRTLTFTYQNGRIVSTSFEGTKKTAYTYRADGRLETVMNFKDATSGITTTFNYDTDGLLSSIVDGNGEITNYLYENGYLKTVQQPAIEANSSDLTYDYSKLANFIVSESDARGNITTYRVNDNYLITSVTNPSGNSTSYKFDSQYNLLSSVDPKGNMVTNTYDTKGNILSTTDSLGSQTSFTYNGFSQPLTVKDANGLLTFSYNVTGDLISEVNPLGEEITYTYFEPYGNLKTTTHPDGTIEYQEYDVLQNHPIKKIDALNRTVSVINDKYGNTTKLTNSKGDSIFYNYDELNRLTSITDAKDNSTIYSYDSNDNLTEIQNGNGHTIKLGYNSQNQFASRIEPLGQKTTFRYDVAGNLTEKIKPDGLTSITTVYTVDNLPEFIRINGYMKWQFVYDQNGNTTSIKNGETGTATSFGYDTNDRLKTITNNNRKIEYNYSSTDTVTSIQGSTSTSLFTHAFVYDKKNQLKNTYKNGAVQTGLDYKSNGLLAERRYVNGVQTYIDYDAAEQLKHLKVIKGTSSLLEETNAYDLNGNLTLVTSATDQKIFKYDILNQLENQQLEKFQLNESYTYDAVGNRLSKETIKNGVLNSISYTYNANNQLINVNGQNYTYDTNGNRTKDEKFIYIYNKFDQITSIKNLAGTTIASYTYDEEGRRISKTVNGKTSFYHYGNGIQVLFESDSTGAITTEFVYDSEGLPMVMSKNGFNYFYIYNSLGEIIALTDSDGQIVASYSYDAWGNILAQSGKMAAENPLLYKGYQYDVETGLYYLIARYYEAANGVFLGTDPLGGEIRNPQSHNGYNYVSNNPLLFVDPDGNAQKHHVGGGGGGGGAGLVRTPKGGSYKGEIPKNKVTLPSSKTASNAVSKKLGGKVSQLKNGYKVEIANGKKPIVVRLMNSGSGGRSKPYFRVSIDGKGSYTLAGKISSDASLTHIDMNPNYLSQITKIVNTIKGK